MDDLISRQAAVDALRAMQTYKLFAGDDMRLIDQAGAQTELMLLPPAQLMRKKGKWTTEDCHAATYKYCCSNCKAHHRAKYDFCPSCGADMRGEAE